MSNTTRERLIEAALSLFQTQGYQKTSIAKIETEAGLVPRAGAFYRHFESKEALLKEVARSSISETPESFELARLTDYADTRAELVAIAQKYEESMLRQKPFSRLIEEVRLLDVGADLQQQLDADMFAALTLWVRTKPASRDRSESEVAALLMSILGGWLFYLSMLQRDAPVATLRETLLTQWSSHWAAYLDTTG